MNPSDDEQKPVPGRWQLFRDVLSFQFKLALDGLRDVVLSPVSIGSALWGMIFSSSNPGKYFYQLLKLGRHSDEWINLFGDIEHYQEGQQTSDKYVHKAQDLIVRQYNKQRAEQKFKQDTDDFMDDNSKKGA